MWRNMPRPSRLKVRLTRSEDRVCLVVSDDGVGFNPDGSGKGGGLGLINMRERVRQLDGTFEFDSAARTRNHGESRSSISAGVVTRSTS